MRDLQKELTDLIHMLPRANIRNKRGLIDAGGSILKFLFGTLTSEDYTHLDKIIDRKSVV